MKHKIGDRVVITGNDALHEFEIGEDVLITELYPNGSPPHYRVGGRGREEEEWYVDEADCQSIYNLEELSQRVNHLEELVKIFDERMAILSKRIDTADDRINLREL